MTSGRILVAEDERTIALVVSRSLASLGCEVVVVHDGLEALRRGREEEFDLAILDQMMPGMVGMEVLRTWQEEGRPIPVIMLSAMTDEEEVVRGLELGAIDYVRKPFSVRELLARVRTHLRQIVPQSD